MTDSLNYQLYEKKDGGIINQIISDEGVLTNIPKEVNEQLAKTIYEIQISDKWQYLAEKSFLKLPNLSRDHLKNLMERLTIGMVITLDGITDSILKRENANRTVSIFRDLRSNELLKIKGIQRSFAAVKLKLTTVSITKEVYT